jgi:hypothetical protein
MPWSWEQYEATPAAVREFCWAFLMVERRIQNSRAAAAARQNQDPGKIRVRR